MGNLIEGCCKSNRRDNDLDQAAIDELNGGAAQRQFESVSKLFHTIINNI